MSEANEFGPGGIYESGPQSEYDRPDEPSPPMPDLSETPTAQELADTVQWALTGLKPTDGAFLALAALQARAEQADQLREIKEAAQVLIREWDESNPFVGYSVEALRIVLEDSEETQP